MEEKLDSTKRTARVAGLLYVLSSGPGFFSLMIVPRSLIVSGNAAATASNILGSESLFRLGIVGELVSATIFIFQALVLYGLFKGVDKQYASLMATLMLVSVPISFLNVVNEIAALNLLKEAAFLSAFQKPQLDAMALMFLGLHSAGISVATIFWGLWLFPFGVVVRKSVFIPPILGVFLIIACFAYVANSLTYLLLPLYTSIVSLALIAPEAIGEGSIIAWLLIKGAR